MYLVDISRVHVKLKFGERRMKSRGVEEKRGLEEKQEQQQQQQQQ